MDTKHCQEMALARHKSTSKNAKLSEILLKEYESQSFLKKSEGSWKKSLSNNLVLDLGSMQSQSYEIIKLVIGEYQNV